MFLQSWLDVCLFCFIFKLLLTVKAKSVYTQQTADIIPENTEKRKSELKKWKGIPKKERPSICICILLFKHVSIVQTESTKEWKMCAITWSPVKFPRVRNHKGVLNVFITLYPSSTHCWENMWDVGWRRKYTKGSVMKKTENYNWNTLEMFSLFNCSFLRAVNKKNSGIKSWNFL